MNKTFSNSWQSLTGVSSDKDVLVGQYQNIKYTPKTGEPYTVKVVCIQNGSSNETELRSSNLSVLKYKFAIVGIKDTYKASDYIKACSEIITCIPLDLRFSISYMKDHKDNYLMNFCVSKDIEKVVNQNYIPVGEKYWDGNSGKVFFKNEDSLIEKTEYSTDSLLHVIPVFALYSYSTIDDMASYYKDKLKSGMELPIDKVFNYAFDKTTSTEFYFDISCIQNDYIFYCKYFSFGISGKKFVLDDIRTKDIFSLIPICDATAGRYKLVVSHCKQTFSLCIDVCKFSDKWDLCGSINYRTPIDTQLDALVLCGNQLVDYIGIVSFIYETRDLITPEYIAPADTILGSDNHSNVIQRLNIDNWANAEAVYFTAKDQGTVYSNYAIDYNGNMVGVSIEVCNTDKVCFYDKCSNQYLQTNIDFNTSTHRFMMLANPEKHTLDFFIAKYGVDASFDGYVKYLYVGRISNALLNIGNELTEDERVVYIQLNEEGIVNSHRGVFEGIVKLYSPDTNICNLYRLFTCAYPETELTISDLSCLVSNLDDDDIDKGILYCETETFAIKEASIGHIQRVQFHTGILLYEYSFCLTNILKTIDNEKRLVFIATEPIECYGKLLPSEINNFISSIINDIDDSVKSFIKDIRIPSVEECEQLWAKNRIVQKDGEGISYLIQDGLDYKAISEDGKIISADDTSSYYIVLEFEI